MGATIAPERETARSFEPAQFVPHAPLVSVPCPNCDCRQFHSILGSRNSSTQAANTFCLVRCYACQLTLTNPRPTNEALDLLSPTDDSPHWSTTVNKPRWQWLEHLALRAHYGYPPQPASFFAKMMAQLAMWTFHSRSQRRDWIPFRAPGRLLDIGGGTGHFLNRMQSFGWTVTEIADPAEGPDDTEHRTGTRQTAESYDAVTMRHVLQRHPNPHQLVQTAAKLLRPGGLLVIEVPNIDSRTFAEFRDHWVGLGMPHHLQHFSPKTLSAFLPQDQLRIVEIQQIGLRKWIQQSAQHAVAAGRNEYRAWLTRGRSFWDEQALRSEVANQADGLRIIAERRF